MSNNYELISMYRSRIRSARENIRKYNQALTKIGVIKNNLNSAIIDLDTAIDGLKSNFIKSGQVYKKKETETVKDKINKVLEQLGRIVIPQINKEIEEETENIMEWENRIASLQALD